MMVVVVLMIAIFNDKYDYDDDTCDNDCHDDDDDDDADDADDNDDNKI